MNHLTQLLNIGRQVLENQFQAFSFIAVSMGSLCLTVLILNFIPLSTSPYIPLPILLVYIVFYLPFLSCSLIFVDSADNLLKVTPRKRFFVPKDTDIRRFFFYYIIRAFSVAVSVYVSAYLVTSSAIHSLKDERMLKRYAHISLRVGTFLIVGSFCVQFARLSQYFYPQSR